MCCKIWECTLQLRQREIKSATSVPLWLWTTEGNKNMPLMSNMKYSIHIYIIFYSNTCTNIR